MHDGWEESGMKKWLPVIIILLATGLVTPVSAERIVFTGNIPLNGRIELKESLTLEVKQQSELDLNAEIAGEDYEIATYEFYSNSPEAAYRLRLLPSTYSEFGDSTFAFKNIDERGNSTGSVNIPFKLSVLSTNANAMAVTPKYQKVEKTIGVLDGSRYQESGSIVISFPTKEEGFNFEAFASGLYEASITVEVAAD